MKSIDGLEIIPFLLKEILKHKSSIETVVKLRRDGYKLYFAPDTSEIKNYTAPYVDITELNFERDIRRWFATKTLLESEKNENILLPPYIYEISFILGIIRNKTKRLESTVEPIKALLKNEGFKNLIDDLGKKDFADQDALLSLEAQYGKELGLLYEIVARHNEIDQWDKLIKQKKLISAFGVFQHLNNEKIMSDSIPWKLAIENRRRAVFKKINNTEKNNIGNISLQSHFDGWAIEYLIQINTDAQKKMRAERPFVVFISRSSVVNKVAKSNLVFNINGYGRLETFWLPDTYLAYHLITQTSDMSNEEVFSLLDDIYSTGKKFNAINDKTTIPSTLKRLIESSNLVSRIENMSMFYEKINDKDFTDFFDPKELRKYHPENQAKLLDKLLVFARKQDIEIVKTQLLDNIERLWVEFKANLFSLSIGEINKLQCLIIKYPGLRIWVQFSPNTISNWIIEKRKNSLTLYKDEIRSELLTMVVSDTEESNLIKAIMFLLDGNLDNAKNVLQTLINSDNYDIRRESTLLIFSIDFLVNNDLSQIIKEAELARNSFVDEPRLERIISLLAWSEWNNKGDKDNLVIARASAQNAIDLIKESSEFATECLNNLAYYQTLQYEMADRNQTELDELGATLTLLIRSCADVYVGNEYPAEVSHTIGKLQLIVSRDDSKLTIKERANMAEASEKNLLRAFNFDPTDATYKGDLASIRKINKEIFANDRL